MPVGGRTEDGLTVWLHVMREGGMFVESLVLCHAAANREWSSLKNFLDPISDNYSIRDISLNFTRVLNF